MTNLSPPRTGIPRFSAIARPQSRVGGAWARASRVSCARQTITGGGCVSRLPFDAVGEVAILLAAVTAIGTLVAGINDLKAAWSWAFPVPSIATSASIAGGDIDAFAVNFRVENTGSISLLDNELSCEIRAANGCFMSGWNFVVTPGRDNSQLVARLDPGRAVLRNCGELVAGLFGGPRPEFPATFTITITSRWPATVPTRHSHRRSSSPRSGTRADTWSSKEEAEPALREFRGDACSTARPADGQSAPKSEVHAPRLRGRASLT